MTEPQEQLQELHEQAERVEHEGSLAPVSLSMAILAVALALATLLGHRTHTEEGLLQTKVADQWAYYQSKNTRGDLYEIILDEWSAVPVNNSEASARLREKYQGVMEKTREKQQEILNEARKMQAEFDLERRRGDRFDLAEVLLEIALVITSITLLTRKRSFWIFGLAVAIAGVGAAASAVLVR